MAQYWLAKHHLCDPFLEAVEHTLCESERNYAFGIIVVDEQRMSMRFCENARRTNRLSGSWIDYWMLELKYDNVQKIADYTHSQHYLIYAGEPQDHPCLDDLCDALFDIFVKQR